MMPALTILADDGLHKAVVAPCDDGATADYYRAVVVNGRGPAGYLPDREWLFERSAVLRLPLHAALDTVSDILNTI
jgi:hypothetical protein